MSETEVNADTTEDKPFSPWLTTIIPAFVSAFLGAAAALGAGWFAFENKDRELDIQLINISLAILRGEHNVGGEPDESVVAARRFAIRTIARLAETELSEDEMDIWAKGGSTPFEGTLTAEAIQEFIERTGVRVVPTIPPQFGITSGTQGFWHNPQTLNLRLPDGCIFTKQETISVVQRTGQMIGHNRQINQKIDD